MTGLTEKPKTTTVEKPKPKPIGKSKIVPRPMIVEVDSCKIKFQTTRNAGVRLSCTAAATLCCWYLRPGTVAVSL
jgi:hypothetical protein